MELPAVQLAQSPARPELPSTRVPISLYLPWESVLPRSLHGRRSDCVISCRLPRPALCSARRSELAQLSHSSLLA
ncbi:hypothetical protein Zm00014a_034764 [Zea mays]|uniref:Uncharacterized protein n=2 Tax=Zea mays TaxID=4577 RepID=A0A3L6FXP3_MAIZE|nr:hypothetical protein Zm00014a_034765 [Zea mays]PWZ41777.1 hypothetical protein Zm00014a_034764 [Zea mays]